MKTWKKLKEKWCTRTLNEQLKILWKLLVISLVLDALHCRFLSTKYNCRMENLLIIVDFYWLSVAFGIIDLVLGILILKRTKGIIKKVRISAKTFSFILYIPSKGQLMQYISIYIILISIGSLLTDLIKFFM